MKKLLMAVLLSAPTVMLLAQDEMSEEEKAYMEFMTPGDQHQQMAKWVGKFKTHMTFWEAPGAEPQVSEGTCENTMILGGRYMRSDFEGSFMGMPFHGLGFQGFDKGMNEFQSTWMDNMGTAISYSHGTYDADTKQLTMTGTMSTPMGGVPVRQVTTDVSDDEQVFEMYMTMGDQEMRTMKMVSTRVK